MKIAVVGIGCRYPGASSYRELYENILSGRRYFREFPKGRLPSDGYYHKNQKNPDTSYCKQAAFIENFDFDHLRFKIPKSTFEATDIAQWLALDTAEKALKDANLKNLPNDKTAVILGNTLTGETSRATVLRYRWPYAKKIFDELLDSFNIGEELKGHLLKKIEVRYKSPFPPINEDNLAGGLSNTIAGRICNHFDFHGGGFTTDGACSSSLLAINQACIGLQRKDFDLALSGGVDISLDPFEIVGFAKVGALSASDIKVYDQHSSGFLPGEGCGVVILKRYDDAINDGDKIYAIVNGVGISSDGKGGITAPTISGQSFAIDRAYQGLDYNFADIELIEGHGTGTRVGDDVELNTFTQAKIRHRVNEAQFCGIGSIKSNIGHTKAAAGVAGFIKAVLSVYYSFLPPTKGIKTPNHIFRKKANLYPLKKGRVWDSNRKRLAAVSSAGFGGINTHITLSSESEKTTASKEETQYLSRLLTSYRDTEVFFIGCSDIQELKQTVQQLLKFSSALCQAELGDLANFCRMNYKQKKVRLAMVITTPYELSEKLQKVYSYLQDKVNLYDIHYKNIKERVFLQAERNHSKIAFMFPGQGSQYINMGGFFKATSQKVETFWSQCEQILDDITDKRITDYISKDIDKMPLEETKKSNQELNDTEVAQPAITLASMASAIYLEQLGIKPDIALGHSLGEYAALWSAGVIDTKNTLGLVTARGKTMSVSSDVPGAMLSIAEKAEKVKDIMSEIVGYATISNINSPEQTVISGEKSAIDSAYEVCQLYGFHATPLKVSSAFHSRLMNKAKKAMEVCIDNSLFKEMEHGVISTMSGEKLSNQTDYTKLLLDQIINPVRFIDAIKTAVNEQTDIFIEVGPGSILKNLTKRIITDENKLILSTDVEMNGDGSSDLHTLLAYLFAEGVNIQTEQLFEQRFFRAISVPYQNNFIISPCEKETEALNLDLENLFQPINDETFKASNGKASSEYASLNKDLAIDEMSKAPSINDDEKSLNKESILEMLKQFVKEEYGYSDDMIKNESRLQNDLGLDSLKTTEVIVEAMANIGVRADASKLGDLSLEDLSSYLYELTQGTSISTKKAEQPQNIIEYPYPDWVRAYNTVAERENIADGAYHKFLGPILIISPNDYIGVDSLDEALQKKGIKTYLHVGSDTIQLSENIQGCIFIGNTEFSDYHYDYSEYEQLYIQPKLLLEASQYLLNNKVEKSSFFVFVDINEINSVEAGINYIDYISSAGRGVLKTFHLEARKIETRSISLNSNIDWENKLQIIIDEVENNSGHVDSIYTRNDIRLIPKTKLISTLDMSKSINLSQEKGVFLVTGGGKGITAECVYELTRFSGLSFALVGSSPLNKENNTELLNNIKRLEEQGINHAYYQCDILDSENVTQLISSIESDLGKVKGVIHAAGINILHTMSNMDWLDFKTVLRPKIEGVLNLLSALEINEIKSFTVFSSIIAQSGMMGNADYSYANEWLNLFLHKVSRDYPKLNCQSYGFSVWADIGMGSKLGSLDNLQKMGISPIPVTQGKEYFVDLLQKKWPALDLLITSRTGELNTINFDKGELPENRFLEKVISYQKDVELITEVFLNPEHDRYLIDHNYDGSLLFPAVMGIEAMVTCASYCVQLGNNFSPTPSLKNMSFGRAIIIPQQGRSIRIYTLLEEVSKNEVKAKVFIRSSVTNYKVDYFSAECIWEQNEKQYPPLSFGKNEPLPLSPMKDLYGKILFQGPMFQNIQYYQELSSTHCVVKIKLPETNGLFKGNESYQYMFGSPLIRDSFLHAVQLCVPDYKILPVSIDEIHVKKYNHHSDSLFLYAKEIERTANEFLYDLYIYGSEGNDVEAILGFRCRIMSDYENENNLADIYKAHQIFQSYNQQKVTA